MRWFFLFLALFAIYAQSDDCYRKRRLELVLRPDNQKTEIFTTHQQLAQSDLDRNDLLKIERWFVRDIDGVIDDVELLRRAGLDKVAEDIQMEYEKDIKSRQIQFFVGLPLGMGMTTAGGYWLSQSLAKENKPTLEVAGGMILAAGGVGVVYGVIQRYITRNNTDIYDHKVRKTQVMDIVDRMNRQIRAECEHQN